MVNPPYISDDKICFLDSATREFDPILSLKKEKLKKIKRDIFIESFIDIIKDKDRKTLLEINQLLINKLNEFK